MHRIVLAILVLIVCFPLMKESERKEKEGIAIQNLKKIKLER